MRHLAHLPYSFWLGLFFALSGYGCLLAARLTVPPEPAPKQTTEAVLVREPKA